MSLVKTKMVFTTQAGGKPYSWTETEVRKVAGTLTDANIALANSLLDKRCELLGPGITAKAPILTLIPETPTEQVSGSSRIGEAPEPFEDDSGLVYYSANYALGGPFANNLAYLPDFPYATLQLRKEGSALHRGAYFLSGLPDIFQAVTGVGLSGPNSGIMNALLIQYMAELINNWGMYVVNTNPGTNPVITITNITLAGTTASFTTAAPHNLPPNGGTLLIRGGKVSLNLAANTTRSMKGYLPTGRNMAVNTGANTFDVTGFVSPITAGGPAPWMYRPGSANFRVISYMVQGYSRMVVQQFVRHKRGASAGSTRGKARSKSVSLVFG